jgi:hypothetical protein
MPILGIIASSKLSAVGDFESIATVSLASAASDITFSSIPSTFTHLQIRYIARTDTGGFGKLTFNSDTTGSNYYSHNLAGAGSGSGTASAYAGSSYSAALFDVYGIPTATSVFLAGVMDILDYTSTNKNKTFRALEGYDQNGGGVIQFASGSYSATPAAISTIKFALNTGSFQQYSHFALYGIRSA